MIHPSLAFTSYLMNGSRQEYGGFPGFLQGTLFCRDNRIHACIPDLTLKMASAVKEQGYS